MKTVDVLGTKYNIERRSEQDDPRLKNCDGYCDASIKLIVVEAMEADNTTKHDLEAYTKDVIRHEIIHAFLHESGLATSSMSFDGAWATNEEMVDWFALQAPKMHRAFEEADAL